MERRGIWDNIWFDLFVMAMVIVLGFTAYILFNDKGSAAIEFMQNLLRFGR